MSQPATTTDIVFCTASIKLSKVGHLDKNLPEDTWVKGLRVGQVFALIISCCIFGTMHRCSEVFRIVVNSEGDRGVDLWESFFPSFSCVLQVEPRPRGEADPAKTGTSHAILLISINYYHISCVFNCECVVFWARRIFLYPTLLLTRFQG